MNDVLPQPAEPTTASVPQEPQPAPAPESASVVVEAKKVAEPARQQEPPKHPGGRPTKYDEKVLEAARAYVDESEDEEEEELSMVAKNGTEFYKKRLKVRLPSIEGLAYAIKVSKETLYQWEKEYPEFSDVMQDLRAKQAKTLMEKGLSGDYNPTIAKVLLTKHGYREGRELTGEDGAPLLPVDGATKEKSDKAISSFLKNGRAQENTG